jgi:hypothetical protein
MHRNHREEEDKKIRRMLKQYNELWRNRRSTGTWIDIDPFQRGYIRYFVLRDDAKNRDDARYMQQVLDMVNTQDYSHREDFKYRNPKTGQWEVRGQGTKKLRVDEYQKLTEKQQSYFEKTSWYEHKWHAGSRKWMRDKFVEGYTLRQPFYYVLKIEPNIVTQRYVPDTQHEALIKEISNYFDRNGLWPRIDKILGNSHNGYRKYDRERYYRNKYGWEMSESEIDVDPQENAA